MGSNQQTAGQTHSHADEEAMIAKGMPLYYESELSKSHMKGNPKYSLVISISCMLFESGRDVAFRKHPFQIATSSRCLRRTNDEPYWVPRAFHENTLCGGIG